VRASHYTVESCAQLYHRDLVDNVTEALKL